MKKSRIISHVVIAMLASIAISAFAEEAPVYDADSYPPQFDGQPADNSGAPPPDRNVAPPDAPPPQGPGPMGDSSRNGGGFDQQQSQDVVPLSLSQRVGRLEQQINNMLHSDASTKMGDIQNELQTLRGQVDDLSHQLQEMQTQQKKQYADLDRRISQKTGTGLSDAALADATPAATDDASAANADSDDTLDSQTSKTKSSAKAKSVSQPNVAEEQQIYQTAYNLIKAKKYNDAASTLQNMLQKYPSGQFAGNAHYWLGQLYSLMGKNDQAVTEFGTVVKGYPDYPKAADAQLKLGLAYSSLMKWSDAKSAFKAVINHYPGTTSAHLAADQLKQIKTSGH